MSDRRQPARYSLEYWAAESVLEQPDQRALMGDHIRRTQVRVWLLVAALMAVILSSFVLEYMRAATGGRISAHFVGWPEWFQDCWA